MIERNDTIATNDNFDATNKNSTCPFVQSITPTNLSSSDEKTAGTTTTSIKFDWSEEELSYAQSAYFVGYISTMIIGANFLIQGLGFYRGLLVLLALSTIGLLLFPLATSSFGLYGAIIVRFLIGASHGPCTSLIAYSWYLWMLPTELTRANAAANVGSGLGSTMSMIVSGQLLGIIGWARLHYLMGAVSAIVAVVWFVFADDAPEQADKSMLRPLRFSNQISLDEKQLIIESRAAKRSGKKVPWAKLFTSVDVWFFSAAWFLVTGAYISMNMYGMRYAVYVSQIPIKMVTEYGGIAAICSVPILILFAVLTDCCISKGLSTPMARKATYTIFVAMALVSFVPILLFPCDMIIVIVFMFSSSLAMGTVLTVSTKPVPNEMAGEYSGQVYSVANTLGNASGIFSEY